MNWNVRNPSLERSVKQLDEILRRSPDIIILTEMKRSKGLSYVGDRLSHAGYDVFFTAADDYGVLVATPKSVFELVSLPISFASQRALLVRGPSPFGTIKVLGVYVPSRGPIERRNVDKMKFQSALARVLPTMAPGEQNHLIVAGDLNVIERNHEPHYPIFGDWEYEFYESFLAFNLKDAFRTLHPTSREFSWFGRDGSGYRFDHAFISPGLVECLTTCEYIHEPRLKGLSDHSMMLLTLEARRSKLPSTA